MPIFEYKAKDQEGKLQKGEVRASSKKDALLILQKNNLAVISLELSKRATFFEELSGLFSKVKRKDLVMASRQLSALINAGLPLVESLEVLSKQTKSERLSKILFEIASDVKGGSKLSFSLSQYPDVFSDFYVSMVRTGEATGQVGKNIEFLADYLEKEFTITSKIKSSLYYPAFIVFGIIVVIILMMTMVMPQLTSVLQEAGGELPWSTKAVLACYKFFTSFWWLILLVILALIVFFQYWRKTPSGKRSWDRFKIFLPFFAPLFKKIYLARFSRSLSALISGGIPIIEALKTSAEVVANEVYKDIILQTAENVKGGGSIVSVIKKRKEFPPVAAYMMAVGEKTGNLEDLLVKLADFSTKEVDVAVKGLVSLIEPIILVILGIIVGIIMAAVLMPIYNLASVI